MSFASNCTVRSKAVVYIKTLEDLHNSLVGLDVTDSRENKSVTKGGRKDQGAPEPRFIVLVGAQFVLVPVSMPLGVV